MRFLQKLPGSRREPAGLERAIMARLPMLVAAGTAIPILCYLIAPLLPPADIDASQHLTIVGIYAIAVVLTVWTAAFTVAIGCLIVMIMKGPAYVADRYDLSDADQPRQTPEKASDKPSRAR
jgi:hypothetical protein